MLSFHSYDFRVVVIVFYLQFNSETHTNLISEKRALKLLNEKFPPKTLSIILERYNFDVMDDYTK